jgi:hypothetical protein
VLFAALALGLVLPPLALLLPLLLLLLLPWQRLRRLRRLLREQRSPRSAPRGALSLFRTFRKFFFWGGGVGQNFQLFLIVFDSKEEEREAIDLGLSLVRALVLAPGEAL